MRTFASRRHAATAGFFTMTLLLTMTLLFSTIGTADAQQDRTRDVRSDQVRVTDVRIQRDRPAHVVETLRLACAPDFIDGQRGVLCQWSEATNAHTRGYKLFRITNGSARELVTTVGLDGRLGFFDTNVSAPSTLVYGVISVNRNGRLLGRSAPAHVQFGQDIVSLRLACAPDFIDGERGVLCRWSEATQPGVRGYQLYRIVGSDHREIIASIGLDGRRGYFDTDIVPDALHTYGVLAVDAQGETLAVGGPVQVRWPAAD